MEDKKPVVVHEMVEVELTSLNRAAYNPRTITREEMAALKRSIRKNGLVMNFVVQKKGMTLIAGHQRLQAIEEECIRTGQQAPTKCWAVVLDVSDARAKQLNVALNKIGGDFDPLKLGELLASVIDDESFDAAALGFNDLEIAELVRQSAVTIDEEAAKLEAEAAEQLGSFARSITLTVEFDTVEQRDQAKALLKDKGGKKPGAWLLKVAKAATAAGTKESKPAKTTAKRASNGA